MAKKTAADLAAEVEAISVDEPKATVITPTIGRVLWYTPKSDGSCGHDGMVNRGDQPMLALVNYVHDDKRVNVVGFDHDGNPFGFREVELIQEGNAIPGAGHFVQWMPYQIGQAKKHAPAEESAVEAE